MNRIESTALEKGIEIVAGENTVVREQKKIGMISRLINLLRQVEREFNDELQAERNARMEVVQELAQSQHELAEAKQHIAELTAKNADMRAQLSRESLQNLMHDLDLTQSQRKRLLDQSDQSPDSSHTDEPAAA